MRIQLVYFDGCPNVDAARETLLAVLRKHALAVPIEEIQTTAPDASAELRRWGSPTILIDGVDVGGAAAPTGAGCRLYHGADGRLQGTPPTSLIEEALFPG
ncbi:MAG: thioredoxin family protein [Candidatus Eisenbacteria bacterium]|uniref:Thioredoxin family protein n=1 Tax=Eiseniibacteriota bacterium TaxID=2212470 RepID=A0A9D6L4L9_UNCEI|nr:thioredoxin family protein [Candidatus Eisenbacteria bacterium]